MRYLIILALITFMLYPQLLEASDFEVFDGQVYNGKFYPRIDIIEWGTPSHMEFHIYSKGKPIEMSFQLDTTKGKKVMLVNYNITDRNEHLCRRVLAPGHFTEMFYVYKDNSDSDFDNVIVSVDKLPEKNGLVLVSNPTQYASCSVAEPTRSTASEGVQSKLPAGDRTKSDESAIKGKGNDVPFSDW